jgi:hypothetical protein
LQKAILETMRKLSFVIPVALVLALAPACGGDGPTDLFPSSMQPVGSGTLTAKAGTAVTIQVKVLSDKGAGIGNIRVTWAPLNGDVLPTQSLTDASGVASTVWTLSSVVGQQTVTASAPIVSPVTFTATATQ